MGRRRRAVGRRGRSDHIPGRAPQACSPGSFPALPHGPGPDVQGPGSVGVLPRTGRGGGGHTKVSHPLHAGNRASQGPPAALPVVLCCCNAWDWGWSLGAPGHVAFLGGELPRGRLCDTCKENPYLRRAQNSPPFPPDTRLETHHSKSQVDE